MILLFDIGNTNTHLGLADGRRVLRQADVPTAGWLDGSAGAAVKRFVRTARLEGAALCSVVPLATPKVHLFVRRTWKLDALELTPATLRGVGIDYPKPGSIGPDRLANAVAARHRFGAPVIVVDFGTAVTFDVVDGRGNYLGWDYRAGFGGDDGKRGGGPSAHDKTALLLADPDRVSGRDRKEHGRGDGRGGAGIAGSCGS
ncbi:MAG: type III pantothenate kinase [Verrucomicrobiota bacterium]